MTSEEVAKSIGDRFKSGNSVPVERAMVTRTEWQAVCDELDELFTVNEKLTKGILKWAGECGECEGRGFVYGYVDHHRISQPCPDCKDIVELLA